MHSHMCTSSLGPTPKNINITRVMILSSFIEPSLGHCHKELSMLKIEDGRNRMNFQVVALSNSTQSTFYLCFSLNYAKELYDALLICIVSLPYYC